MTSAGGMSGAGTWVTLRVPSMPVQTYIRSMDKDFVAATIQAIGRCATNIGKVRDTCLNGLVQLLSNRDGEYTQQR